MGKTYAILGGGGSFGIHAALYLLDHANPKKVIGVGRNPLRPGAFSLGIDKREGYEYHAYHITYELDLLLKYPKAIEGQVNEYLDVFHGPDGAARGPRGKEGATSKQSAHVLISQAALAGQ